MRILLAASLVLLPLSFHAWTPTPAAADGEKTYDLSRRDRWQVGDVRTRTGKRVEKRRVKRTGADGLVAADDATLKTTTYTLVEQCMEADAEGHATSWRAFVKAWALESGGTTDEVLKGAFVVATTKGRERAYALEPADLEPTTDARTWLEITFGPKSADSEALLRALVPPAPVAVGQTWAPDGSALGAALGSGMPFDAAKITCTATLRSVEEGLARRAFEITVPLKGLSTSGGGLLPWTSGGVSKISVEGTVALEGRIAKSKGTSHQVIAGTAKAGGVTIEVDIDVTIDLATEIGGEMPKPPEPPKPPDVPTPPDSSPK